MEFCYGDTMLSSAYHGIFFSRHPAHSTFQQSYILCSETWKTDIPHNLDITLSLNSVTTQWVTQRLFLLSLLWTTAIFSCAKPQLFKRLTITARSELAGIPIIYHQTGILSIVGVNLRIWLSVYWFNSESLLHATQI